MKLFIVVGFAIAASAAPVLAQIADPGAVIATLDQNHDGVVELNEYCTNQLVAYNRALVAGAAGLTLEQFKATLSQSGRQTAEASFTFFDKNADTMLDQDEFIAYHTYVFSNVLDLNKDGKWTADEYRTFLATNPTPPSTQGVQPNPEGAISFLDKNLDGAVDLDEYIDWQQGRFEQFDANHNGRLSLTEFRASLDARGRRNAEKSLYAFDVLGAGDLTLREFLTFHAYVFQNVLDRNHDGKWTVEEYRAYLHLD